MVKVTREISVQWLASVICTIVVSVVGNGLALYLSITENKFRQESSAERQKDYNDRTNDAIKGLTDKVSTLVNDGLLKRDYDKEQDYKLQDLNRRVTNLEMVKK